MVMMSSLSPLVTASWLYNHGGGEEERDGSCFPTPTAGQSENQTVYKSYTCRGENITSIPSNIPRNITQL
ncbi:hypothetical protein BaRGS_00029304, partial [Batillaria attramentaria]